MLLGLGPGLAHAHVPHDVVASVAVPSDLDPGRPWFALVTGPVTQLVQSDDGGRHFSALGGAPLGDAPVGVALLDDETLVVLGDSRLWWRSGDAWASEPLTGSFDAVHAVRAGLLLAGPAGLYEGRPGALALALDVPVAGARGGDAPTAWGSAGELWSWDGSFWASAGQLPGTTLFSSDGVVEVAGTGDGLLFRREVGDQDWFACGPLPGAGEEESAVVQFSTAGAEAWVATGLGVFRSTDACASWGEVSTGVTVAYEGAGSPDVPAEVFTSLLSSASAVLLAGWYGLRLGDGGGLDWSRAAVVRPDLTRGLAVAGSGPTVFTGPYASGPLASPDGGRTWTAANHGVREGNVQEVLAHAEAPATVYALVNHAGTISRDGGMNWFTPELPASVERFSLGLAAREVFAVAGGLYVSGDEGRTWAEVPGFADVEGAAGGQVLPLADGTTCVRDVTSGGLWCSEPGTGRFSEAIAPGGDLARGAATTSPSGEPVSVVIVSGGDVARHEPSTGTTTRATVLDTDRFTALATADDSTILAGTAAGQLLSSRDGGDTWTVVDTAFPAGVEALAPAPGFGQSGELLVATAAGNWMVSLGSGGAADVEPFSPVNWIDDASGFVGREGCGDVSTDRTASLDTLTELVAGCELRLSVYGATVSLHGRGDGGVAEVTIDAGAAWPLEGPGADTTAALVELSVDEGWHDLVIGGIEGDGLWLDYVVATSPGAVLSPVPGLPGTPESPGCGCGTARAGAPVVVLGALLLAWRRRRNGRAVG